MKAICPSRVVALLLAAVLTVCAVCNVAALAQKQPRVAPAPGEPDWEVVLRERYGLSMSRDLKNPVKTTPQAAPGLFRKAGQGQVSFAPVIALGLPARTRGGWYKAQGAPGEPPKKVALWSYVYKNTERDLRTGKNLPPPLEQGARTTFDPGDAPFGLWVSNDELADGGVYSEPALVARWNRRLAHQPYKAMIYPNRDKAKGKDVPHSFVIGWEYSTNDDFQDVVCQLDNATLEPAREDRSASSPRTGDGR